MTYEPRPGSLAFRAIGYLDDLSVGTEMSNAALAEALGVLPATLAACLMPAAAAGLVFRRQRDTHPRSPLWWSVTDHTRRETLAHVASRIDAMCRVSA
jgi:hypothetical protein